MRFATNRWQTLVPTHLEMQLRLRYFRVPTLLLSYQILFEQQLKHGLGCCCRAVVTRRGHAGVRATLVACRNCLRTRSWYRRHPAITKQDCGIIAGVATCWQQRASASNHGVGYTFPSHFFPRALSFPVWGRVQLFALLSWCYPSVKCNFTFRVLQPQSQVEVISNSRILTSHFWPLSLHPVSNGLTFFRFGVEFIFHTFSFDVTL